MQFSIRRWDVSNYILRMKYDSPACSFIYNYKIHIIAVHVSLLVTFVAVSLKYIYNMSIVARLNHLKNQVSFSDIAVREVQHALKLINTYDEATTWIRLNKRNIRLFRKMLEEKKEHRGKLEANIGLAKSYHKKLHGIKNNILKQGGGLKKQPQRNLYWQEEECRFDGRLKTGLIINMTYKDPIIFFDKAFPLFQLNIRKELLKWPIKVYTIFSGKFLKPNTDEEDIKTFMTEAKPILMTTDLHEWYCENIKDKLLKKLEEFQERDSGWALDEIINIRVYINKYNQLKLGNSFCDLPAAIKNKRAVVNVHNNDQHCFLWSIMSALHPVEKHVERVNNYPHYHDVLKYEGLEFPMTLSQIPKFEKSNTHLSINVYSYNIQKKEVEIYPVYLSKNNTMKIHLLIVKNDKDDKMLHFCWIKNLAKLARSGIKKDGHKIFICDRCLNYFSNQLKLEQHMTDCKEIDSKGVKIRMPTTDKEKYIEFENYMRKEQVPFIVYADFEALLQHMTVDEFIKDQNNSYTVKSQKHIPYSVGYYLHCSFDTSLSFYRSYRGDDCVAWFVSELQNVALVVYDTYERGGLPMESLTQDQLISFTLVEKCHICNTDFKPNEIKVKDHCHLTGKYRGAAHQWCNLNYKDSRVIPVVMHNLSGYDSHFIIGPLVSNFKGKVDVLPVNKEQYISFTKHVSGTDIQLRFIDSFRFMACSLDKLASYLCSENKIILRKHFNDDEEFKLLSRKGIFPYDYVNAWERLNETQLPPLEEFYSKLNDEHISTENYEHAQSVWQKFNIHTLGEYSDIYLKTDVLLLADVFENFRKTCMNSYGLDPAHYYTLPGFTWEAMLKHTGIRIELFTDVDQLLFIERGIRGGLSQVCGRRYAKANNKYMREKYDPEQDTHYLMYYDVVNLYGHAMCMYMPTGNFKWIEDENFDVQQISDTSPVGFVLEVDLKIPVELHDKFNDLPPCPETRKPPNSKQNKLLASLYDKERYIVHYRNLKQYLELGVKVTRYHRIMQFDQSPWLQTYIDFNTDMRKKARNDFEKNLYKLFNNALFGKFLQNVRKHRLVYIRSEWDGRWGIKHLISQPNFHSLCTLDSSNNLTIVEMNKTEIFMNKPIYIGFCILDISKTFVYDFHYNYMHNTYGENVKLLYTDTDSLIYDIQTNEDVYEVMKRDIHKFDTSDFEENNIYGMPRCNKKVKGLMSDENNGDIMLEFIGLRSKMYAIRVQDKQNVTKKSKGLKIATIKTLTFEDYLDCLVENKCLYKIQKCIRSQKHSIFTIEQKKVGLSPFDNKRFIIANSVDTLPWGHYKINV